VDWIRENKNKIQIAAINFLVRKIVKTTNYSNKAEVNRNSKRVRNLFKQREKLYTEGLK
jgi:hypothetical protein